jgi:hypothetical protein
VASQLRRYKGFSVVAVVVVIVVAVVVAVVEYLQDLHQPRL